MKTAILRYNAGNTASVSNALRLLGVEPEITDDPCSLATADKIIFPGVGEARSAMQYLSSRGLDDVIRGLRQPILGICLGMQLFCSSSEEHETECLGIVPLTVRRFPPAGPKVPHMGWSRVTQGPSPLFNGVDNGAYFYFVHSYFAEIGEQTVARAEHGLEFTAAIADSNFYGVQFHPERSGEAGARVLENFLKL